MSTGFSPVLVPPTEHSEPEKSSYVKRLGPTGQVVWRHLSKHVGVGIVCSVAYFDPGNWSVDLQAGSDFSYRPMLFVVLLAGLGAMVLQVLACKLGCVTGVDLASHCRLLLQRCSKRPRLVRWLALYPLYVMCEIAIICTDLAEMLGSAVGLCLLIPSLPMWAGVVLTAVDVLVFLAWSDPSRGNGKPVKTFEGIIMAIVAVVFVSFLVLLVKVNPHWSSVFMGYIPSKDLIQTKPDAVYTAIFLGSFLSTQNRVVGPSLEIPGTNSPPRAQSLWKRAKTHVRSLFSVSRADRICSQREYALHVGGQENNSLTFVQQHLNHGIVDILASLSFVAIPINSAILVIAATVFYKKTETSNNVGLFDAYDLISQRLGSAPAIIFALALLLSGQMSSVTATLSGQVISEGFIRWKLTPFLRRLVTRLISVIPAVVVAASVGRSGVNTLLVASQAALSFVLPFISLPLVYLTSCRSVMTVVKPNSDNPHSILEKDGDLGSRQVCQTSSKDSSSAQNQPTGLATSCEPPTLVPEEYVDYSNGWPLCIVAWFLCGTIFLANGYAIVMLGMGKS